MKWYVKIQGDDGEYTEYGPFPSFDEAYNWCCTGFGFKQEEVEIYERA